MCGTEAAQIRERMDPAPLEARAGASAASGSGPRHRKHLRDPRRDVLHGFESPGPQQDFLIELGRRVLSGDPVNLPCWESDRDRWRKRQNHSTAGKGPGSSRALQQSPPSREIPSPDSPGPWGAAPPGSLEPLGASPLEWRGRPRGRGDAAGGRAAQPRRRPARRRRRLSAAASMLRAAPALAALPEPERASPHSCWDPPLPPGSPDAQLEPLTRTQLGPRPRLATWDQSSTTLGADSLSPRSPGNGLLCWKTLGRTVS